MPIYPWTSGSLGEDGVKLKHRTRMNTVSEALHLLLQLGLLSILTGRIVGSQKYVNAVDGCTSSQTPLMELMFNPAYVCTIFLSPNVYIGCYISQSSLSGLLVA